MPRVHSHECTECGRTIGCDHRVCSVTEGEPLLCPRCAAAAREDQLPAAAAAPAPPPRRIEVYGIRGLQSKPWRRTFPSQAAYEAWLQQNGDDVQVLGTREEV